MAPKGCFFLVWLCASEDICVKLLLGDAGVSEPLLPSHAVSLQATVLFYARMILLYILLIDKCVCFPFFFFGNIWRHLAEIEPCGYCQGCCLVLPQRIVVVDLQTSFQTRDLNMSLSRRQGPLFRSCASICPEVVAVVGVKHLVRTSEADSPIRAGRALWTGSEARTLCSGRCLAGGRHCEAFFLTLLWKAKQDCNVLKKRRGL